MVGTSNALIALTFDTEEFTAVASEDLPGALGDGDALKTTCLREAANEARGVVNIVKAIRQAIKKRTVPDRRGIN
jgi:hypothetical protein